MPSCSFFASIHWRLCETGSLDVHKPDTGRQRISRKIDAEERVVQALQRNPSTSIWVVSRETHIHPNYRLAQCTRQRTLLLSFTTYPGDNSSHVDFARWYLQEKAADWHFTASVLFTDEDAFSLESEMNCHNLHRWADENPHATHPHAAQWGKIEIMRPKIKKSTFFLYDRNSFHIIQNYL